jgi:hypothetical protein
LIVDYCTIPEEIQTEKGKQKYILDHLANKLWVSRILKYPLFAKGMNNYITLIDCVLDQQINESLMIIRVYSY